MRNYGVSGRDQLQELIDKLKEDPNDRRMIICMWNSDVLDEIALPACHSFYQFYTRELLIKERYNLLCEKYKDEAKSLEDAMLLNRYTDIVQKCDEHNIPKRELSCSFYCRSQDFCLGTPYNIASASLLVHMIAQCVGMSVGELVWNGGDCHLYLNQLDGVKEQLSRDCDKYKSPQLKVNKEVNDINNFAYEDFEVVDYECYPSIKYPLSVGL